MQTYGMLTESRRPAAQAGTRRNATFWQTWRNHVQSLVIIPTYNERENIQRLVPIILNLASRFDILIIDDASPDGTGDVAETLAGEWQGRVHVLHRPAKL